MRSAILRTMDDASARTLLDGPLPPSERVYRVGGIIAATFLGGPLAGGYMLAMNFKAFGEQTKARWSLAATFVFAIALCFLVVFVPAFARLPRQLVPLTYSGIVWLVAHHFQHERIAAHTAAGGMKHPWWRNALVIVISFVMLLAMMLTVAALAGDASTI